MNRHQPLSAFDQWRLEGPYPDLNQLVALNRLVGRLRQKPGRRRGSTLTGEWRTHQRGRGIDFDQVRAYQAGDDIRAIDWRVTARRQAPHTKLYQEERERPVILAADLRSPMFFGSRYCFKSVQLCALLGGIAWIALAGRDRVGGLIFGDQQHQDIRPRRSRHSVLALLRQLDTYSQRLTTPCPSAPPAPLSQLLDKLLHTSHPGSALYIGSDFHDLDAASEQRLFQLGRHCDLTLLLISDPLEQQLPQDPQLWVGDGHRRIPLASVSHRQAPFSQQHQRLRDLCRRQAIPLHPVSTADAPLALLGQLFGQPGVGL